MALAVIAVGLAFLLQLPSVQSSVARKAIAKLENITDARITFSSLEVMPFSGLILKDLAIVDTAPVPDAPDTLFCAADVNAAFGIRTLFSHRGIYLNRAIVRDADMNLVMEPGHRLNLKRIFRIPDSTGRSRLRLMIRKAEVETVRLRILQAEEQAAGQAAEEKDSNVTDENGAGKGMDFRDLNLRVSAKGHNLSVIDKTFSLKLDEARAKEERSGYRATVTGGIVRARYGEVDIIKTRIRDGSSDILLNRLRKEFLTDSDAIEARLSGSVSPASINTILGTSLPESARLELETLDVSGDETKLSLNSLKFRETLSGINGTLRGGAEGLWEEDPKLKLTAEALSFDMGGAQMLLEAFGKSLPEILSREARYRFDGSVSGELKHLKVKGRLAEDGGGAANTELDVKNLTSASKKIGISGTLHTEDLGIGRILGNAKLGECTLGCGFSAELGRNGEVEGVLDSLRVSKFGLMGYDYRNLRAQGRLSGTTFDGRVVCNDPNLNFLFQGLLNFSRQSEGARYNFFAYLAYADLHALGADSREISRARGARIEADFRRIRKGEFDGSVRLNGLKLESADTKYDMGEVTLNSHSSAGRYSFDFSSDFAHARFRGTQSAGRMVHDVAALTVGRELPVLKNISTSTGESYEVSVQLHDTRELLSFVTPGLYIADSSFVRLRVREGGQLTARAGSSRLAFGRRYIKGLELSLDNEDNSLNCKVNGREMQLSDALRLENNSLMLYASGNNLGLGYYYDNSAASENRGEIYLTAECLRDGSDRPAVKARSLTSNIYANGRQWRILPAGFGYGDGRLSVDSLRVECDSQSLTIDGGVSRKGTDTLEVRLSDLDLGMLNSLSASLPALEGRATGKALIFSPTEAKSGILAKLLLSDTSVSGYRAGDINAGLSWDNGAGELDAVLRNSLDSLSTFDIRGSYSPKNKAVKAQLRLQDFEAGYFSSFARKVFSTLEGKVSGKIDVGGRLDRLDVSSGTCSISSGVLGVDATGVDYFVGGTFHIDNSGIHFDEVTASDGRGGKGRVSGGLLYERFRNFRFATAIEAEDIRCVALDSGERFYGHLNGTGKVTFEGPFSAIRMEAEAVTSSKGDLHIPIKSSVSSGSGDLLKFKEKQLFAHVDPYEQMMSRMKDGGREQGDFSMGLKITATPAATCNVEIGENSGASLKGHGRGDLLMEIRPSRHEFSIGGDYTLSDGDIHISAMGLANRNFTINEGSSISFNGDIMESSLSIDAVYNTKASIANLIVDTTSVSARRNVECGISVTGKLRDPSLAFSINIPDVDPLTKTKVESALSTDDKVQRQFLALLLTGSFLPDEGSGVVSNPGNILYSNVADLMANQLNGILERLQIPLDLGLGYRTASSGTGIFDVAVSTQLFDNRVIMNGTIGNRQMTDASAADVVGDIDIEIKLDRSGYLRLTLFSHSANWYTSYLDRLQRSGFGFAYQKEFNTLGELLRSIFAGKQKREQMKLDASLREKDSKTIVIE